ncbi:hypothetical protein PRIPAC_92959 [Pristionchus pacificus]|uniref:Uncharacterized protein n=1 Tax=Pristionchus pacificus TaxID=54126 RepID=A0A2A6BRJ4_PRIPA|nr:hypothetical protein PRIPAC_92959 [Pristionchus pacificus]|eukprot:PDM68371.1 hypothetical protein PRIPAC_46415 [Pristionchus pacificus]
MPWQLLLLFVSALLPIASALSCYTSEVSRTARAVLVPQYSTSYANCSADCDEMKSCLAFYYNDVIDKCAPLGEVLTAMKYCPAGPPPTVQVKCTRDETTPDVTNGTETSTIQQEYNTTESTPDITNGTTTIPGDVNATDTQLVKLDQWWSGVRHGFCVAEGHCLSTIKKQIGNSLTNTKAGVGKIVKQSEIDAVRAQCPIGSKHLVLLGFTYNANGQSYTHNFQGNGLPQGYVSRVNGSCGSTRRVNWHKHTIDKHNFYGYKDKQVGYDPKKANVFFTWN